MERSSNYKGVLSILIGLRPQQASNCRKLIASCAINNSVDLLRKLHDLGANLSLPDKYGWTPLELARKFRHEAAMNFLAH